jgi:hypothetical protein
MDDWQQRQPFASRRAMLAGCAALGVAAMVPSAIRAQASGPRLIDTHHHIYPPDYVGPNLDRLLKDASALPASAYTSWTPQSALEQMDKAGIATAIVSIRPGSRPRSCR